MKKIIHVVLALASCSFLYSQNCHDYFPFSEGTEWELSNYDEKDKLLSVNTYKILSRKGNVAEINFVSLDKKGKEVANIKSNWYCDDNKISFEMKDMFPASAAMNNTKAEMKFSGNNLDFPKNIIAGESLPDADAKLEMYIDGMRFMTMSMNITDRKVDGNEKITTPMGTFDCLKISQTTEVKSIISNKSKTITYLSKSKGMIKSENFNSKGKLIGYQLMTRFKS